MSDKKQKNNNILGYLIKTDELGIDFETYSLNKKYTNIGRSLNNDIILTDETVKREHCVIGINKDNDTAFITSLDKRERLSVKVGTHFHKRDVNPNRGCKPFRNVAIKSGYFITIGREHFKFYLSKDYIGAINDQSTVVEDPEITGNDNIITPDLSFILDLAGPTPQKRNMNSTLLDSDLESNNDDINDESSLGIFESDATKKELTKITETMVIDDTEM